MTPLRQSDATCVKIHVRGGAYSKLFAWEEFIQVMYTAEVAGIVDITAGEVDCVIVDDEQLTRNKGRVP